MKIKMIPRIRRDVYKRQVYDTLILVVASLIVYLCALSKREIKKGEGDVFLLCYLVFFVYVLTR